MYQGQPALRYRVVPRADSPWSKNVHRASCPGYKNVPRAACPRYTRACRIWPHFFCWYFYCVMASLLGQRKRKLEDIRRKYKKYSDISSQCVLPLMIGLFYCSRGNDWDILFYLFPFSPHLWLHSYTASVMRSLSVSNFGTGTRTGKNRRKKEMSSFKFW